MTPHPKIRLDGCVLKCLFGKLIVLHQKLLPRHVSRHIGKYPGSHERGETHLATRRTSQLAAAGQAIQYRMNFMSASADRAGV